MKPKVLAFLVVLCLGLGLLAVRSFSATVTHKPHTGLMSKHPAGDAWSQTWPGDITPNVETMTGHLPVGSGWFAYYQSGTQEESDQAGYRSIIESEPTGGSRALQFTFDPEHWYHPPMKVLPNQTRNITLTLYNSGTGAIVYRVSGFPPCVVVSAGPTTLPAGASHPIPVLLDGTGPCNGTFIAGNVTVDVGGGTVYHLPVHVVVAEDYYECPRDPETVATKSNDILQLRENANCQQEIDDIGSFAGEVHRVFFRGGTIVATSQDGDIVVGRFMGENDWRAGARDKLCTDECNVSWEPHFWLLYTKDIYIEASHLTPPNHYRWWWWEICKQIKIFKPGAPPVYQHIVIKYVKVKRKDQPGWWPDQTPFTHYEDTYIGLAMDIDCPCNAPAAEPGANLGGYDPTYEIAWQRGYDNTGAHPEYNNYYAGLALAEGGTGSPTTPYGVDNVKNNRYLWPTSPWGWVDGELYQLAVTPGIYIQEADSFVNRSTVVIANVIPAGVDPHAKSEFTLIEAFGPNGLPELQDYVATARLIVELERRVGGIPIMCGDVNGNYIVDIGDLVYLLRYSYLGGPEPLCPIDRGDVNNDGIINAGDIVYLINFSYRCGPEPNCPCICY